METYVWGIGLSRTGTTSLNNFLQRAGWDAKHYPSAQELFSGRYNAATDLPPAFFFRRLTKRFKKSKFILTVRDREQWLESTTSHFERKKGRETVLGYQGMLRRRMYGSIYPGKDELDAAYSRHFNAVTNFFHQTPEKLLVLNIADGNAPLLLAKFLSLSEFPEQMPHLNARKD